MLESSTLIVLDREIQPMVKHVGPDRRQSFRVELSPGLTVHLQGHDYAELVQVSLGGCVLETKRKLQTNQWSTLEIPYENRLAVLNLQAYQSFLHELFYSHSGDSRIRYRSRAVFFDPTIETLNLLYRILMDFWPAHAE